MALDAADLKQIGEAIAAALKTNNDELGKRFVTAEGVSKVVEQAVPGVLKSAGLEGVGDTLKALQAKLDGEEGSGKGKKKEGDVDPEVAKLQAKLAALEGKSAETERARQQAEQAQRDGALDGKLRAGLDKLGIPAARHEMAIAYLRTLRTPDGKPVLRFKDDGTPVWGAQRTGYVDELDVAEGLTEWGATDAAKVYLPPAGKGGTGNNAGGDERRGSSSTPKDKDGNVDWKAIGAAVKLTPEILAGG